MKWKHLIVIILAIIIPINVSAAVEFSGGAYFFHNHEKLTHPRDEITIEYMLYYKDVPKDKYEIRGSIFRLDNESPLLIDGQPVASTLAAELDGTGNILLTFTFDSKKIKNIVLDFLIEIVDSGNNVIGKINFKDDFFDTRLVILELTGINTEALNPDTKGKNVYISTNSKITDTVNIGNLIDGKEYVLESHLIDKKTNSIIIDKNSNPIKYSNKFIASNTTQLITNFEFDSSHLEEKELVIYNYLYLNGELIAVHADNNDKKQTVMLKNYPKCSLEDGTYYDNEGNETSKEEYDVICNKEENKEEPLYSCEIVDNVYYDKNGNPISKEDFQTICEIENPKTGNYLSYLTLITGSIIMVGIYFFTNKNRKFTKA